MQKNYFKRYIWILDLLQTNGKMTLNEIQRCWIKCPFNYEKEYMPIRTFHHNRSAIAYMFGIDIECDRHTNEYYIANTDDLNADSVKKWLLDAMSFNNLVEEASYMKDKVIFEQVPVRRKSLVQIIRAIRDKFVIEMDYKNPLTSIIEHFQVEPLFIRIFRSHWYMLGKIFNPQESNIRAFRIEDTDNVVITDKKVSASSSHFDAKSYSKDYFGVGEALNGPIKKTIKMRVSHLLGHELDLMPPHPSQMKIEEESDENTSVYTYSLILNQDVVEQILSYGDRVEVLEPQNLRVMVKEKIHHMMQIYQDQDAEKEE